MSAAADRIQSPDRVDDFVERMESFRADVIAGLSNTPRSLASKYFYDDAGSALFDQICDLEEYYPTRTETQIMLDHGQQMAARIGSGVRLIEFGSGSSMKTRVLLADLDNPVQYAPVDISGDHLVRTAEQLGAEYPSLSVTPVIADFTEPFDFPNAEVGVNRTCIYFPGSTIGNFTDDQASRLLADAANRCDQGAGLLIGIDLQKDTSVLESAYNDRRGVTAAFNKNMLHRINSELDGNFDIDQFTHHAFYNQIEHRIEMHLISQCEQDVSIGERSFGFASGDAILTEYSHKYTVDEFARMAQQVGWHLDEYWTDADDYFAVMLFEA